MCIRDSYCGRALVEPPAYPDSPEAAWIRAMATQIIEVATDWRAPATPVRLANTDGAWP